MQPSGCMERRAWAASLPAAPHAVRPVSERGPGGSLSLAGTPRRERAETRPPLRPARLASCQATAKRPPSPVSARRRAHKKKSAPISSAPPRAARGRACARPSDAGRRCGAGSAPHSGTHASGSRLGDTAAGAAANAARQAASSAASCFRRGAACARRRVGLRVTLIHTLVALAARAAGAARTTRTPTTAARQQAGPGPRPGGVPRGDGRAAARRARGRRLSRCGMRQRCGWCRGRRARGQEPLPARSRTAQAHAGCEGRASRGRATCCLQGMPTASASASKSASRWTSAGSSAPALAAPSASWRAPRAHRGWPGAGRASPARWPPGSWPHGTVISTAKRSPGALERAHAPADLVAEALGLAAQRQPEASGGVRKEGAKSGPPARLGRQQRRQGVRAELAAQEGGQARRVGRRPRRRAGGRRRVVVQAAHGLQQPVEQPAVLGGRADDAPPQRLCAHQLRRGLRVRGRDRGLLRPDPHRVQRPARVACAGARASRRPSTPARLQPGALDACAGRAPCPARA